MIPNNENYDAEIGEEIENDFDIEEESSLTYKLDLDKNRIIGTCDGLDAVKQAVYLILNTERYDWIIYSWDFGIEIQDLFGESLLIVSMEVENRIHESLTQDDRIEDVTNFIVKSVDKKKIQVEFTVVSTEGNFSTETEVKYNV